MTTVDLGSCERDELSIVLGAVSAVFESFGRVLICLDESFSVVHTSSLLKKMLGDQRAEAIVGQPAEEVLGELFGRGGALRQVLEAGERREGWRASLLYADETAHFVSISAAPFIPDPNGACDPRVKYVVIVRPAEDDLTAGTLAPTVFSGMIGRSTAMAHLFQLVDNLQESEATILLTGESGTGKEVLARAIHQHSPRRKGSFLAVNCAALPGELLESELFGHVRGAFTGAVRDRVGRFEMASGGTLFLDEIGDMPLLLQVKLLRVLQEKMYEAVGDSHSRKTNVRIIAATNLDLRKAIAEGRFREDLYYRLRVVPIELPPLRARREDIEPLAHYLLARVTGRHGRAMRFSPDAVRAMLRYAWPGNVRELENAIEYAVAVGRGQTIQPEDLPLEVVEAPFASAAHNGHAVGGNHADMKLLRAVLDEHHWRRDEAARALGISRTTLWRRMREAGLV